MAKSSRKPRMLNQMRKVSPARINQRTSPNPINAPWSENNPLRRFRGSSPQSEFQKRMDELGGAYNFG